MGYKYETLEDIIKLYGNPILQFRPEGNFTELDEQIYIPYECALFKINHVSEIIVYCNRGNNEWYCNCALGSRFVIRELLKRLEERNINEN